MNLLQLQQKGLPLAAAILVLVVGVLVVIGSPPENGSGLPMDDAYIHLDYARNLALHGEVAFNHGFPSAGTTSLGWDLFLMPPFWLGIDAVVWSIVLSLLSHALCAYWFARITLAWAEKRNLGAWTPLLAVALFALNGPLLWYGCSGMETSLMLASGLAALWYFGKGRRLRAALWCGLSVFMRVDCMLLAGSMALVFWLTTPVKTKGRVKGILILTLLPLLFYLPAMLANLLTEGTPWPGTLLGRVMLLTGSFTLFDHTRLYEHLLWWIEFVQNWVMGGSFGNLVPDTLMASKFTQLLIPFIGFFLGGLVLLAKAGRKHLATPAFLLWSAATFVYYGITLPIVIFAGRYEATIMLLFVWAVAWSVGWVVRFLYLHLRPINAGALSFLLVLLLLSHGLMMTVTWSEIRQAAINQVTRVHIAAGLFSRVLPEDTALAVFDVGAVKYLNPEREIVDWAGLTDVGMRKAIVSGQGSAYLREKNVGYIAVMESANGNIHPYPYNLAEEIKEGRFTLERNFTSDKGVLPLPSFAISAAEHKRYIDAVLIAEPRMTFYRVIWQPE